MRIIAGKSRGVPLVPIKGTDIRPTLDRVRESVFNILTPHLDEACIFLDLFAGTGANGLEALSRGVQQSIFVDSSSKSLNIIQENLEKLRIVDGYTLIRGALPGKLTYISQHFDAASIIYADPPFKYMDYEGLLNGINSANVVDADGLVLIEHDTRSSLSADVGNLHRYREETYGQTQISFYRTIVADT